MIKCSICKKEFANARNVAIHIRKYHPAPKPVPMPEAPIVVGQRYGLRLQDGIGLEAGQRITLEQTAVIKRITLTKDSNIVEVDVYLESDVWGKYYGK